MGTRGPVPKRSTQRAGHRTKAEQPTVIKRRGPVEMPPPEPHWAPAAKEWYEALAASGQSEYFEPSDWAYARILAQLLSLQLTSSRPSSEMMKALLAAMGNLGTTEADRRRMRIEVERAVEQHGKSAELAVLEDYRRLAANG